MAECHLLDTDALSLDISDLSLDISDLSLDADEKSLMTSSPISAQTNPRLTKKLKISERDRKIRNKIGDLLKLTKGNTTGQVYDMLCTYKDKVHPQYSSVKIQYNSGWLPSTDYWNGWKNFNKLRPNKIWLYTIEKYDDLVPFLYILSHYAFVSGVVGQIFEADEYANNSMLYGINLPNPGSLNIGKFNYSRLYDFAVKIADDSVQTAVVDYFKINEVEGSNPDRTVYRSSFITDVIGSGITVDRKSEVTYVKYRQQNNNQVEINVPLAKYNISRCSIEYIDSALEFLCTHGLSYEDVLVLLCCNIQSGLDSMENLKFINPMTLLKVIQKYTTY